MPGQPHRLADVAAQFIDAQVATGPHALVAIGPKGEGVAAALLLPSSARDVGEVCLVVQEGWQ